jgi:CIC family chloride channel protein
MGPLSLALLSVVLGVGAGLGALVFRSLIALVHEVGFLGYFSFHYDTSVHTPPAPWGKAIVLLPVLGSFAVVFLVRNFAPEAKGHGVPEVMNAIYYGKSVIRPVVALVKSVASALSIGTGGSVGREGPIVQISAALASVLGRVARVSRWQRATLVAAGGGAGIAATFNTPIGGMLFAVEILMPEVSIRTLVPVALATTTATYVGRRLFGAAPAFVVPAVHPSATLAVLPAYVILGALMAVVAVVFIRAIYGAEDLFERAIPRRDYLRHALGMLGVGLMMTWLMAVKGHYYIEGVGYATVVDVLTGSIGSAGWLLALGAMKLVATSFTLGSGGSGGIFSPSLFMGATIGGAFGVILRGLFPGIQFDPAAFALAGMAGMVAGATGAALTAIVMIFEMTLDYSVVLPMALTVAVSQGGRRLLLPESIYTMKLARRGRHLPAALQANAHLVHHVGDIAMAVARAVPTTATTADVPSAEGTSPPYLVLVDGPRIVAVVDTRTPGCAPAPDRAPASLRDLARHDFVVAPGDATLFELLATMQHAKAELAVVLAATATPEAPPPIGGVITKAHLAEVLAEGMELFED